MLICQHAASGCNYPEGECIGLCATQPENPAAMLIRHHKLYREAIRAHDLQKSRCAGACESESGECLGGCNPTTDCLPFWQEAMAWIIGSGVAILCLSALLDSYAEAIAGLILGGLR